MSQTETTNNYLDMDLLRFSTAGSVDDGKSTLIGRLMYDTKSIFEDQLEAIEKTSENRGYGYVNLALLTDGLRSEREQGITIDVAYRYFATPKRKFIIADTPGHIQYTRNMVTGASTANLSIVLIDARHGMVEQTCRHAIISSLLKIKHLVVCVNKMDLVAYSQDVYEKIKSDFEKFSKQLEIVDVKYIPISALNGDNVVDLSENMPWYKGNPLLDTLENVEIARDLNLKEARFPVQNVIRPLNDEFHDYRGYAGRVEGGVFKKGDAIIVLPSGKQSKIKAIDTFSGEVLEAFPPMSVAIRLEDEIDVSRGDMIVTQENLPLLTQDLDVMVCWLNEKSMVLGGKYIIKNGTKEARCIVKEIKYKLNINTLEKLSDNTSINVNDIAKILIRTTVPLPVDFYKNNRNTGSIILIDEFTNETLAAGMIE